MKRTESKNSWLQAIFNEMQEFKKEIKHQSERRIGRAEFSKLLNLGPEILDARIRARRYKKPYKDGRKRFWFYSYVQSVILDVESNHKAA
ncbi:hypothetical protein [Acinetobacter radioresistens]|uniref:hypothetical protein n=1 Tax=Acinetobacter radioresistens TaxID=40216 RepID=UPI002246BC48|nr:hypothetical protein [Acinetobacter radioresistens]MCX0340965.1 hypothetical protein [Acinetobacter radioresistens]